MDVSIEQAPELPKIIDVLGKKFKVIQIQESDTEYENDSGFMHLSNQEIGIRMYSAGDINHDTILHEVIHAVDEILHLRMKENQVHQLAAGLIAVLKQNKELAKWLTQ